MSTPTKKHSISLKANSAACNGRAVALEKFTFIQMITTCWLRVCVCAAQCRARQQRAKPYLRIVVCLPACFPPHRKKKNPNQTIRPTPTRTRTANTSHMLCCENIFFLAVLVSRFFLFSKHLLGGGAARASTNCAYVTRAGGLGGCAVGQGFFLFCCIRVRAVLNERMGWNWRTLTFCIHYYCTSICVCVCVNKLAQCGVYKYVFGFCI